MRLFIRIENRIRADITCEYKGHTNKHRSGINLEFVVHLSI